MAGTPVWYLALLGFAAVTALATAIRLQRAEPSLLQRSLQANLLAVAVWTTMTFGDKVASSPETAHVFTRLTYLGIPLVTPLWLVFVLEYSDAWDVVDRRLGAALAVEPILVNVLVWTNGSLHELWWTIDWSAAGGPITGHGPAFFAHVVYLYVLTLIGVAVVVDVVRRRERTFRRQSLALAAGAFVPLAANVAFVASAALPAVGSIEDPTPPAFAVSGILFYWVVTEGDVGSISPVARETLVNTMSAAMVVLREGRVVDINQAARDLLGVDDEAVVGTPIRELVDRDVYDALVAVEPGTREATIDTPTGRRHYEVEISPVGDGDRRLGKLLVVQDITDRIERERELERKNEQLEGFANALSHDLRNPLSVATGYVDLVAEQTDDEAVAAHAESAQVAHERMSTLVEDILTMAREGESVEDPEPVSLWECANTAWRTVDTGSMTLAAADEAVESAVVLGDPGRLQRLFENCFRNAREHAGSSVTVTVGTSGFGDATRDRSFWIGDDGPGIPADRREAVMEEGVTTDDSGTGFGLAIVRTIAEGHGWSVAVEESEAGGAKFVFGNVAAPEQGVADVTDG